MSYLAPSDPLTAVYADLSDMTLLLNCGETIRITELLDEDGEECEPDEAVIAIATNGKGWWRVPLLFLQHTLH